MTDVNQAQTQQDNDDHSADAVAPAAQNAAKPGFHAATEDEAPATGALAAQEELDRQQQAEKDAATEDFSAALPVTPFTPFSAVENQACLTAIASLWGVETLPLSEYMNNLSLVHAAPTALQVQGSDHDYLVGKDYIESDSDLVTARGAFEMALLAQANPVIAERGVELAGSLRDRYLLTLAADHVGIQITNPVHEADLPADLVAECAALKAEWQEVVKNPENLPSFSALDHREELNIEPVTVETGAAQEESEAEAETPAVSVLKPEDLEHFDKAKALVQDTGRVSNAFLQRNLQVGFNRAARLITEMENQGLITPPRENGKRDVLVATAPKP